MLLIMLGLVQLNVLALSFRRSEPARSNAPPHARPAGGPTLTRDGVFGSVADLAVAGSGGACSAPFAEGPVWIAQTGLSVLDLDTAC